MTGYFESSKSGDIEHDNRIFIQSKQGFMIAASIRVKVLPDITTSVEVASLIVPLHRNDAIDEVTHDQILVDADNGNLIGATESCLLNFGIPYSLCYGNTKRNAVLNITQIFPKIQSIADIKGMKNDALLTLLDTSMVPSIFSFEWDTDETAFHRAYGKFSMHSTKARLDHLIKDNSTTKNKLDIILIELMKASRLERGAGKLGTLAELTPTSNMDITPNMDSSQQEVMVPEKTHNLKKGYMAEVFSRRASILNKTRSSQGSQKLQNEEEVEAMIAQQEKIRRLREKRAMIDAPATTSEIFFFKSSIYLMTMVVTVWLLMNTIVCHSMAALMTSSTTSMINLSERSSVFPVLAREYRIFDLLLHGNLTTTASYSLTSIGDSIKANLLTLKSKEAVTEISTLSKSNIRISIVEDYKNYHFLDLMS
jgi:hypothetical protein